MNTDSPAYRAAMDRNAAAATDAITNQARRLGHLDSAEAIHRLSLALQGSRMPRDQLAAVLAALAVHTVRADQHAAFLQPPTTTGPASVWKAIRARLRYKP